MQAGKLDKRVTFQRATQAVDEVGQSRDTWADLFTTWCELLPPMGGFEAVQAGETTAQQSVRLRIRKRTGLRPTDRLIFPADDPDALYYNITAFDTPDRGESMTVNARARSDGPDSAP